ncbi:MAG: Stage II sporulation protein E [Firmicutes bacterium ADurb.Bin456]|nr:MAG: Stage II sporulation protein E [Firmicutes bacterium ADurb.Bin456]
MFEEIEIYPYHRTGNEKAQSRTACKEKKAKEGLRRLKPEIRPFFSPEALALAFAGFFLGRAVLLGELMPFAASFVAASVRSYGRAGLLAVPGVLLGLATIIRGWPLACFALVVAGVWLLTGLLPPVLKRPWVVLPGLVFAVTVIVKTSLAALTGTSSYAYFTILFEAVFAALLTGIMLYGLGALKRKARGKKFLTGEEIFCILLVFGGVIAGTGELKYEMISLKGVLSGIAILLSAFMGGAGFGAAAGAVAGIIPGLAYSVAPAVVGAYSFAGLLAGVCRGYGKAGTATGFLLGSIILSVYVTEYNSLLAVIAETGIAALIFLLTPRPFITNLKSSLGITAGKVGECVTEGLPFKEIFAERIRGWARVFLELSRTFEQVSSATGQGRGEQSLQKLLNQVGEKVCDGCAFYRTCWEREFYKTYQGMVDLLALVEIHGKITPDNLSRELKRRCSRTRELAITINCLYESYNLNRYWSQRLLESRCIVSEQLKGVSEVMTSLPGELDYELEAGDLGSSLRKKLREAGIQVECLSVTRRQNGGLEVSLSHPPCGGLMKCRDVIAPALSTLLEERLSPAVTPCIVKDGDTACHLRFNPDLNYCLTLGLAGTGKNGSLVSGDNYAFFHLNRGRFALVLSDGMGSGPRAAMESGTTISLLRHLLDSGFGQDLAVKTVNSILVLRSPGESFATVDLAVINLYTARADFVKIGAVPSFILRGGLVEQVRAEALPVGILDDIEVATLSRNLEHGDVLVMVTDGLLYAKKAGEDKEAWLSEVLRDMADMPPQQMAELLLRLAQTGSGGTARAPDDMTVLVARLEKQRKAGHLGRSLGS